MNCLYKRHRGFTLIELIAVILVLSILAAFSTSFVVDVTRSFINVSHKNTLLTDSRLTIEYMARQLRLSLPHSARVTNTGRCLQFLPIVASGKYLNLLPSSSNGAPASGRASPIVVAPYDTNGRPEHLSIAAASADEIYGTNPISLASIQSNNTTSITLAFDKQWQRNSINQRFFLTANASAFCLIGNEIRFYRDLSLLSDNINLALNYDVLMQSVDPLNQLYTISSSTEDRNIRIGLSLRFFRDDVQLNTVKQVVIRNVP